MAKEPTLKQEDEYFYHRERELIENTKKALEEKRELQKEKFDHPGKYLKCPTCKTTLTELNFNGVKADRCSRCEGVYFDEAAFSMLAKMKGLRDYLIKIKNNHDTRKNNDLF